MYFGCQIRPQHSLASTLCRVSANAVTRAVSRDTTTSDVMAWHVLCVRLVVQTGGGIYQEPIGTLTFNGLATFMENTAFEVRERAAVPMHRSISARLTMWNRWDCAF